MLQTDYSATKVPLLARVYIKKKLVLKDHLKIAPDTPASLPPERENDSVSQHAPPPTKEHPGQQNQSTKWRDQCRPQQSPHVHHHTPSITTR